MSTTETPRYVVTSTVKTYRMAVDGSECVRRFDACGCTWHVNAERTERRRAEACREHRALRDEIEPTDVIA